MRVPKTPTEQWEARTGQNEIKPGAEGHLERDELGRITAILGKPTPPEKVRTSLAGRKQAARWRRQAARPEPWGERGEKSREAYHDRKRPKAAHVRVARRQGAVR
jgi:hypothetical protein